MKRSTTRIRDPRLIFCGWRESESEGGPQGGPQGGPSASARQAN